MRKIKKNKAFPAALYPRERTTGTDWMGGWVDLRAGLDTDSIEQIFASAWDRIQVV
jgi:hypothetical protein